MRHCPAAMRKRFFPGRGRGAFLAAIFAIGMIPSLGAAEETLPKAEEIIARFVEATGGKEAREKIHNSVSKGTIEIVGMGIKGTTTIYAAGPNKTYSQTELAGIGTMEGGTNGEVAWRLSALQGSQLMEGAEKAFMLRAAIFNRELQLAKLYPQMECTGTEAVHEKPCYKVILTPPTGNPETWFLDQETYLLLKAETILQSPMGEVPVAMFTGDYREVDGLRIAHRTEMKVLTQDVLTIFETVEHNVDIPTDRFDFPEEIQKLMEKAENEETEEHSSDEETEAHSSTDEG